MITLFSQIVVTVNVFNPGGLWFCLWFKLPGGSLIGNNYWSPGPQSFVDFRKPGELPSEIPRQIKPKNPFIIPGSALQIQCSQYY